MGSGIVWVLWLKLFAPVFAHGQFILTILGLLGEDELSRAAGLVGDKVKQQMAIAAASGLASQVAAVAQRNASKDILKVVSAFHMGGAPISVLGHWGPYVQVGLGSLFLVLGCLLLVWYCM